MGRTSRFSHSRQGGFTLVELMVGMTIALISTIVIIQVMSFFEAQRRTTSGSADAQSNGGIALFTIGRDVQMAGYPLFPATDSALECTTTTTGGTGITDITPITITNGVAAGTTNASDSITIRYGSTLMGGAVTQLSGALVGSAATVSSNLGCQVGDATLISSAAICRISTATAVSAAGVSPISVTLGDTTGATTPQANFACLGPWNEITYSVDQANGNLVRTSVVNGVSGTPTPIIAGVVNLQAQYGVSAASNSNQITQWVDASGGTWAAPTVPNRNRIKAIRLAVVARNANKETSAVTVACSSTGTAAATGLCAWQGSDANPAPAIDLSPGDADWARYRYRVFETIIPLRNVIWSKDTL